MADVLEAAAEAFDAEKMNVESLGNGDAHLLFHGFPSCAGDLGSYGHNGHGPVWCLPFEERYADEVRPSEEGIQVMVGNIRKVL